MTRPPSLPPVVLGPVAVGGRTVRLRPARFDDVAEWRRIRLRDEERIRPFWATTELDWEARHTEAVWVRELLRGAADARAGVATSLAVEVDGRFAGQCALTDLDRWHHAGELGIWVDSTVAGRGVGQLATAMLTDYAFDHLGLARVTAPTCVHNVGSRRAAAHAGLRQEALMVSFMDVGGRRQDHELWAVLRDPDRPSSRVAHALRVHDGVEPDRPLPVSPASLPRVPLTSPTVARTVARYRAGRLRARLRGRADDGPPPSARAGEGTVRLVAVDPYRRTARLLVDDAAAAAPAADLDAALRAVLDAAFGPLGLCRVSAVTGAGHDPRTVALVAAGLRREGTMHDHRDLDGRRGEHDLWATTVEDRAPAVGEHR
ncbi:hypothetical protein GCM10009737_19510 [Nocardioides lentus]|uniref:N-acetyltransferase domain-containing protein n=1 Tax=Nocardioides lentus TaxID=338077 RepID=A0ABN2PFP8_9ACTN